MPCTKSGPHGRAREARAAGEGPSHHPSDFTLYYDARKPHGVHDLNFLFSEMEPLYIVQTISTDGINK